MLKAQNFGERFDLLSPTTMPNACGFLWNKKMMLQVNCRGYAIAQFMQPEPAKYTHAPNLEAKTFMQPEQPYYAHHPGRFFYIKDEETSELTSVPYAPVKATPDAFTFSVGLYDIQWHVKHLGLEMQLRVHLPVDDSVELWEFTLSNPSDRLRKVSVYPYFPFGYMSWMNQSGEYRKDLGGIVASCVTPYQKVDDYFKNRHFKDKTFLLHELPPDAFDVNQAQFEGEGGLNCPDGILEEKLSGSNALYETPAAILQYQISLAPKASQTFRFILGPAHDDAEIERLKDRYLGNGFETAHEDYQRYIDQGKGILHQQTPDTHFDAFANHWLARQVYYHGDVNRLTTDPQTRNYLQDNMGMSYIMPDTTRKALIHALSQQEASGAMPDGILLIEDTELKYINQIPHTDHCVWLPVCLKAYLDETNDYAILTEPVTDKLGKTLTVFERICNATLYLVQNRDERGLSYIAQGDPMNMVGYKGKGVSGWLTIATAYALKVWADICHSAGKQEQAERFNQHRQTLQTQANEHLWDGQWYARGITDDGVKFGCRHDTEGRIFLNPQSWAILAGICSEEQKQDLLTAIDEQLVTPYGPMMLAPAYTGMRDDVGRVTQKFPGSAENGSVYNHASVFYIYSLYTIGEADRAWDLLRNMLAGPNDADYLQRGQMPVYIPNYYRGAYYQHPRTAGRSSQLFNTGTVAWVYRCLIEGLFGLKGTQKGLQIAPQLPSHWASAKVTRHFRGATFDVTFDRVDSNECVIWLNDKPLQGNVITDFEANGHYKVKVQLPRA